MIACRPVVQDLTRRPHNPHLAGTPPRERPASISIRAPGYSLASAAERPQDRIKYGIQLSPDIFGEEPQREVAVLLQQLVLATIASICNRVSKMRSAVQLDRDTTVSAQQIDLRASIDALSPRQGQPLRVRML